MNKNKYKTIAIITAFVVIFFGVSKLLDPITSAGIICLAFITVSMIGSHSAALWVFWLISTLMGYANVHITSHPLIRYGDDLFAIVLLIQFISMNYIFNRRPSSVVLKYKGIGMWKLIQAISAVFLASAIVNRSRPDLAVNFFLSYLLCFYIFLHAEVASREWSDTQVLRFILWFFIANFIVDLTRFAGLNIFPNIFLLSSDRAVGLIGDQTVVAYLYCGLIPAVIYLFMSCRNTRHRLLYVVLIATSCAHFALTYTAHASVFLLCSLIYSFIAVRKYFLIVGVVALAIFGFTFIQVYEAVEVRDFEVLKVKELERRYELFIEGSTVEAYKRVIFDARKDIFIPAIGAGPGKFSSSIGFQRFENTLAARYLHDIWLTFSGTQSLAGKSITQQTINGFCSIWGELGWMGFILFAALHIYPCYRVFRFLRNNQYASVEKNAIALFFICGMFVYLVSNLLRDLLYMDVFLGYWILLGILWQPDRIKGVVRKDALWHTVPRNSGGGVIV